MHQLSPSHTLPSLLMDADGWRLFYFHSHPWKKVDIYFFLWWVDGNHGYWRLFTVCCSEFPAVTELVWQGGLRRPDGWSGIVQGAWGGCQGAWEITKEHLRDAKEGQGCSKDGRQLFRSASVLLPLPWHVTTDLQQLMEDYGWSEKHSNKSAQCGWGFKLHMEEKVES